jgi:hypothetical protein
MADASAGLTRYKIKHDPCGPYLVADETLAVRDSADKVYIAPEADALLADLRGKLQTAQHENKELRELADTHDADYEAMDAKYLAELKQLQQQLEAERATACKEADLRRQLQTENVRLFGELTAERAKVREIEPDARRYRWLLANDFVYKDMGADAVTAYIDAGVAASKPAAPTVDEKGE